MPGLAFDFDSPRGKSWMDWERRLRQQEARANAAHGLTVTLTTKATMTPYDPSAGPTMKIMHYLKHGWAGGRARMMPRWPGGIAQWIREAQPYRDYALALARWVLIGPGTRVPGHISDGIGESMKQWIIENLLTGGMSPSEQYDQYRSGEGGAYGPRSGKSPEELRKINLWEKDKSEDAKIKKRASFPSRRDSRFADVYASRGPGFLESMEIEVGKESL